MRRTGRQLRSKGRQFEKYRHLLRDEEEGVEKVIRALEVVVSSTYKRTGEIPENVVLFPKRMVPVLELHPATWEVQSIG